MWLLSLDFDIKDKNGEVVLGVYPDEIAI